MAKQKKQTDSSEHEVPVTVSSKKKKDETTPPKKVSTKKTKTKVPTDQEVEPLDEFQTGEALATRQGVDESSKKDSSPKDTIGQNGLRINNVKLLKELFLEIKYDQSTSDGMVSNSLSSQAPVHDDFKTALNKLDVHCAILADQYAKGGKLDTEGVTCVGFTIRTGNVFGVKLIANRTLADGKTVNINPPFTKLGDGSTYEDAENLEKIVDEVIAEAVLYLGGKHRPNVQQDMFAEVEHTATYYPPKEVIDPANERYVEEDI